MITNDYTSNIDLCQVKNVDIIKIDEWTGMVLYKGVKRGIICIRKKEDITRLGRVKYGPTSSINTRFLLLS